MIKNPQEVMRLQRAHRREHPLTLQQKYAMLNAMYEEAKLLGKMKARNAYNIGKHKLAMTRIMNAGV